MLSVSSGIQNPSLLRKSKERAVPRSTDLSTEIVYPFGFYSTVLAEGLRWEDGRFSNRFQERMDDPETVPVNCHRRPAEGMRPRVKSDDQR